jgi:hypothetical protein
MSAKKDAKIAETYQLIQKYPGQKSALLDRLLNAKTFTATIEDFNAYDSLMVSQNIVEPESTVSELDIPGFTQSDKYSDSEILRIFEARDSLKDRLADIGSPPTDAEWYQAGKTAEERIAVVRPFYDKKRREEEALMEFFGGAAEDANLLTKAISYPTKLVAGTLMTGLGAITQLAGGWYDMATDFSEEQHETLDFPWIVPAEMYQSGVPGHEGRKGYTPELLEMEAALDELYGHQRVFKEKLDEGGYRETLPGSKSMTELDRLNTMINEAKLLPPQMFGEGQ